MAEARKRVLTTEEICPKCAKVYALGLRDFLLGLATNGKAGFGFTLDGKGVALVVTERPAGGWDVDVEDLGPVKGGKLPV